MNQIETVVIFCGGKGTRLGEVTDGLIPKPMVKIGNYPIVWHLIEIYRLQGINHVILCTGHLHDYFNRWFSNIQVNTSEHLLIDKGLVTHYSTAKIDELTIDIVYTGENTMTASRLAQVQNYIKGDTFFLTYGDGLSNVNLTEIHKIHKIGGYLVTITGVTPPGRFGELEYTGTQINSFSEKPIDRRRRINGGFMCVEKSFISRYLTGDVTNVMLEDKPFAQCAEDNLMGLYAHDGFWQCMDNPRDYELLSHHASKRFLPWLSSNDENLQ